ncbi:hypothetical protein [Rhodococcus sp. BE178]|uniref:hypothetical protein n=1 Tax=Rhodococcus sp. BE178 TaxID=2817737 RepID=UPI003D25DB77
MIDHETGELIVPDYCPRGHELTARTTHITTASGRPTGWTCVRCIRLDLWRAHYDHHTNPAERGKSIPPEELAETRYQRQNVKYVRDSDPSAWTERVHFASGWGYDREDPTPEIRQAIREAAEQAERDRAAERARCEREKANADLLALCRGEGAA